MSAAAWIDPRGKRQTRIMRKRERRDLAAETNQLAEAERIEAEPRAAGCGYLTGPKP